MNDDTQGLNTGLQKGRSNITATNDSNLPESPCQTPTRRRFIFRVDRFMRVTHLYTGLFLVPWMLVYATSAAFLNHGPALREWLELKPPHLEVIREAEFTPTDSFPQNREQQATAILAHLELDGPHRVLVGQSNARRLKIVRICGAGNYIVTWNRMKRNIVIQQQQPFSVLRFINFLHFKGGYSQPYPAHILWAVIVDFVAASIVLWVISGIYLWARRPKKRVLGGVVLLGGIGLFVGLIMALLR